MKKVAEVLVELSNKNIDKTFDYNIPPIFFDKIKVGIRVKVPFGNQTLEGFIIKIKEESNIDLKEIIDIIDDEIVLNDELLSLGKIMQEETLSTLISCYQVMLPKALKAKHNTVINKKLEVFYKLNFIPEKLTSKQEEIIKLFKDKDEITRKELISISASAVKTLEEKGALEKLEKEKYRVTYEEKNKVIKKLTEEQLKAVKEIEESNDLVFLIHGVTGSGKTEVYMELIDKVLKEGKTAIVLVPEISLTPQMVSRFTERFGNTIAALHSALSDGEKYDEWRRIAKGEAQIVIGARSALFAPLNNLGLIIIDEEHSESYKQDDSNPRYDAKTMAIERAKLNDGCKVVMGSATPSLEAYARASSTKKVYHLINLPNRVNKKELPKIKVVDMNQEFKNTKGHFSKPLLDSIIEHLEKNEQIILLLNRRGYSSFVTCKNCGEAIKCPNCDISLTYHKTSENLRCHYCGYATNKPKVCPKCLEDGLSNLGVGTEKIEEELNNILPTARVLRMDFDTTSRKGAHAKMIESFKNHEYDILLGTQIVAKGLDFENVTLVGIINADTSLNIPDFRSSETTFSLLSQVAGRSGRSSKTGEVILQTFNPDHYAINYAKNHDYLGFYKQEMVIRKNLNYPPFYYITTIRVGSIDYNLASEVSRKITTILNQELTNSTILGPAPASIFRVNNVYNFQIIIKYKKEDKLKEVLDKISTHYSKNPKLKINYNFNPNHL